MTHDELVQRAEKWLGNQGCGVVFRDEFRAITHSGEQPDAIGWRDGLSILIECKASRYDRNWQLNVMDLDALGNQNDPLAGLDACKPNHITTKQRGVRGLIYHASCA